MPSKTVKVLRGVRVLETDAGVAARYCGRLLAQLGATVVAHRSDPVDDRPLGPSDDAGVAYGRWLDAGKQVTAAAAPDDTEVEIGGRGDGPLQVRITWFGDEGPYAGWHGDDELVLALSGLAHGFGPAEGPPTIAQGHMPQVLAGANAANLVLAALLRPVEERPDRIDVSVLESVLCITEVAAVTAIDNPKMKSPRVGVNRFVPTYPATQYRAADGWIGLTCLTPPQWQSLCDLVGAPDLVADPTLATALGRLLDADRIDAVLAPAFAQRPVRDWTDEGLARRLPLVAVPRPSELPRIPHWVEREAFAPVEGVDALGPTLPFMTTSTSDARSAGASDPAPPSAPLTGIRVVDFTMGWAGPQATRMLADLGADVVKVESSTHPDWYRGWDADPGGDPPARELQSNFNTLNRNKRGIDIDLTDPAGQTIATRLVETADIVIENYAAGVMTKLGLGHDVHRRHRADVVSVSMPAFGSTGPLRDTRAYGSTVEQASGLPFVNGRDEWPPVLQHVAFGDAIAGIYAVTAVLSGLHLRRSVGGVDLDLAQVQCLFEVAADAIIGEQVLDRPLPRTGNARRGAISDVVAAEGRDAWLAVVARTPEQQTALDDVLDGTALADWAVERSPAEAARLLQDAGVPAAPVNPPHALGTDPHLIATGFWEQLDRRYVGKHTLGAPAFRINGRRPVARRPAPTLGEHTDDILAEIGAR